MSKGIQAIEVGTVERGAADSWVDDSWDDEAVVGGVDLCYVSYRGSSAHNVAFYMTEARQSAPYIMIARASVYFARECDYLTPAHESASFD